MTPRELDWRSVRPKLRNVLVHAYLDVDHRIVAAAVPLAVEQHRDYARQVARRLSAAIEQ